MIFATVVSQDSEVINNISR